MRLPGESTCASEAQQQVEPETPEASALLDQFPRTFAQILIVVWRRDTPQRPAVEVIQMTSPALGVAVRLDNLARGLTAKDGLGHFRSSTSLSTWMSSA